VDSSPTLAISFVQAIWDVSWEQRQPGLIGPDWRRQLERARERPRVTKEDSNAWLLAATAARP